MPRSRSVDPALAREAAITKQLIEPSKEERPLTRISRWDVYNYIQGVFFTVPPDFHHVKKELYKEEILMLWCQIQWELKRAGKTQRQVFIWSIRQVTLDYLWFMSKVSTPLLFLFCCCP